MKKEKQHKITLHPSPITVFLFFVIYFIFQTACTPDPPPTLNYKDRQLVDSLFRQQIDSLKPLFDSICASRHDSAVQFKVDSMMKVRQSEIKKYLDRIKEEEF